MCRASLADQSKRSSQCLAARCRAFPHCARRWAAFWGLIGLLTALSAVSAATTSPAVTLDQLRRHPNLTPERFMAYFHDFEFKLGDTRRAPEVFLAAQCGDCDDFACLAADILGQKKYTTRLIAIFMPHQTHVVCYVEEVHGYLDYNCRREACAVQSAGAKIEDVADKVAAYFRTTWRSASEFTYQEDCPRFGRIVFR